MLNRSNLTALTLVFSLLLFSMVFANDYLIYDPCGSQSADDLSLLLEEQDYSGEITDDIQSYIEQLDNYNVLFIFADNWCEGFDSELAAQVADDILVYLNNGGAIYWQGENTAYFNDTYRDEIFQFDIATCATNPSEQLWSCSNSPFDIEVSTEVIYAEMIGGGTGPAFESEDSCWCKGIFREEPFKAILTTFPISSITDAGANTKDEFVAQVMSWLTTQANIEETEMPIPEKLATVASYPNPFNAQTQIRYSLSLASDIKLVIYNVLGQPVETLYDGYSQAGEFDLGWNGSDYTTGIYFIRLESDKFTECEKLILLK